MKCKKCDGLVVEKFMSREFVYLCLNCGKIYYPKLRKYLYVSSQKSFRNYKNKNRVSKPLKIPTTSAIRIIKF